MTRQARETSQRDLGMLLKPFRQYRSIVLGTVEPYGQGSDAAYGEKGFERTGRCTGKFASVSATDGPTSALCTGVRQPRNTLIAVVRQGDNRTMRHRFEHGRDGCHAGRECDR